MKKRDEDIIFTDQAHVSCEGGDYAKGHPKIYLQISEGSIICPYCSREFVLKKKNK